MTVDGNSKSLPRGVNLSKVGDDTNNDHDEGKSKDTDETPKGKICCLLCRGFISYKNSDRTRFRDHMANEHDVKFDSDVILAVSVMSAREKQHIVAAAMSRLAEIGNNQLPSTAELLLPRPAAPQVQAPAPAAAVPAALAPAPASRVPVPVASRAAAASPSPSSRGRGGGVSSPSAVARGRGSYRGTVIRPQRPAAPQQLAAAAAAGGKAPFNIQNMSISISVVDQTAKCTQCPMTFKNSVLLAEHTKTVHLARFANLGLSITAPGEKRAAGQEAAGAVTQSPGGSSKRARPEAAVRTPPPQRGRGRGRGSPAVGGRVVAHQQQVVKSEPVAAVQQQPGGISRQQQGDKVDPVIKCNDCAQFIKQSVFKDHKMGHLKEKTAASSVPATQSNSKEVPSRNDGGGKGRVIQRKEEKQVDYVDLGEVSDEDEITDVTKKKVLEKKLPCPSCDAMFATTMSLKMHMNLSHPVKTEATDTEQLLTEEGEDSDKVRDEMNSLGTSEMLDDLVNFLNEL